MEDRRSQRLIIFLVGWLLSAGVLWSAEVYALSLPLTAGLLALPWMLAWPLSSLAARGQEAVRLDLTKIAVQGRLRTEHYSTGAPIVRQGDVAEHFYILTSGHAKVYVDDEYGSRTEVAELVPGQFFGEVGLLTTGVRMATVEAADELDVLVLDKEAFADIVNNAGVASDHIREVAEQRTSMG